MRTIKIKVGQTGACTLFNPLAKTGRVPGGLIKAVEEVPDEIGDAEAVRIFSQTADATWLSDPERVGRRVFRFSELGPGKLIKE
jgi:hypothetical protein